MIDASLAGERTLDRLDEGLAREGLCQVSDTSGRHRGHTRRMIVLAGNVDNGQGNPSRLEPMAYFDAGIIAEIYIENDADGLLEIAVLLECIGGWEQHAVIAVLPQESSDPPQHARVVIDHKHQFLFRQDRRSFCADWMSIAGPPPKGTLRQIEATGSVAVQLTIFVIVP
jgi:hypothetical protein